MPARVCQTTRVSARWRATMEFHYASMLQHRGAQKRAAAQECLKKESGTIYEKVTAIHILCLWAFLERLCSDIMTPRSATERTRRVAACPRSLMRNVQRQRTLLGMLGGSKGGL